MSKILTCLTTILLLSGRIGNVHASSFPTTRVDGHSVSGDGVGVAVNHGTVDARQEHHQHGASNMNHIFVNSPPPQERERKPHEYFAQGEVFINKKPPNWDEAFEVFLFAANAEPPHPKACVRCAEYYHYKQNPPQIQEALYYYERAISVSGPKPQDAYKGLMTLYYDLGMKGRKNKKGEFLQKAKDYGEKIDILDDESMLDDIDTQLSQLGISLT